MEIMALFVLQVKLIQCQLVSYSDAYEPLGFSPDEPHRAEFLFCFLRLALGSVHPVTAAGD